MYVFVIESKSNKTDMSRLRSVSIVYRQFTVMELYLLEIFFG